MRFVLVAKVVWVLVVVLLTAGLYRLFAKEESKLPTRPKTPALNIQQRKAANHWRLVLTEGLDKTYRPTRKTTDEDFEAVRNRLDEGYIVTKPQINVLRHFIETTDAEVDTITARIDPTTHTVNPAIRLTIGETNLECWIVLSPNGKRIEEIIGPALPIEESAELPQ